ncbi:ImmA/IrrE family metallo-endopeptidase [Corallococcus exercitus]|uniref:ImmA/IrrE family metallo-endopeptidase n=1 Tax=Corallococcus exercitus TaxID=2316736 RepID=A0A7Y4K1V4_9BACT|nr:ImmA/IrrE family metallo-endopeptidase [Corallococcus exercitus]NOK15274.1 ImmA/IrrE family metallo-endopeptidase [Corallococcus exercitus]NOK23920.1 ImmA/IrrE family metallo-endopeptidase [Corallococcus carmarthensis]
MNNYEDLMYDSPVPIYESAELPERLKGLYIETTGAKKILLNRKVPTSIEKACILAEELGHYYTSSGNILDQTLLVNRKQEQRARAWAYEKLVPLESIIHAHRIGIRNRYELADYLNVTEDFLNSAISRYRDKHGKYVVVDTYTVCLDPLGVFELFE